MFMKQIRSYSTEELEQELERRKHVVIPNPSWEMNWDNVIRMARSYVAYRFGIIEGDGWDANDDPHYLFEEVIKAVYGEDIFDKCKQR